MSKKVFVGNLPFSVTDDKLKELFSSYGEITEAIVIKNKFSGRSKGFGFITFANEEDADKAIAEMHDKEVEGRKITVREATPFNPDAPRPQRRNGFGSGRGGFNNRRDENNNSESSDNAGVDENNQPKGSNF